MLEVHPFKRPDHTRGQAALAPQMLQELLQQTLGTLTETSEKHSGQANEDTAVQVGIMFLLPFLPFNPSFLHSHHRVTLK